MVAASFTQNVSNYIPIFKLQTWSDATVKMEAARFFETVVVLPM